jgi:hypothetical protein
VGGAVATASPNPVCQGTPFNLTGPAAFDVPPGTVLSPTGNGGFENATSTFAANGWSEAQPGTNREWQVGTAGGAQGGTKAAYLGSPLAYNGTSQAITTHFYRDIVIPAFVQNVSLTYYYRMPNTDATFDFFYVFTTTTANTPVSGVVPGSGYTQRYTNTSTTFANFTLMAPIDLSAFAGTTVRLVFTFLSDGALPHANPAVDNVSVTHGGTPPLTFAWTSSPAGFTSTQQNPGSITPPLGVTTYTVASSNAAAGTCAISSVTVTQNPLPSVSATNNSPFCSGTQNLNLTSVAPTAATYLWTGPGGYTSGAANPTITNAPSTASGNYKLKVTDANGCQDSVTTAVTIYALPGVSIIPVGGTNICTGQTTIDLLGNGANTYLWSTTETINPITVSTGGTYSVVGTDGNNCQNSSSVVITETASPAVPVVSPSGTVTLCYDASGPVPVTLNCSNYSSNLVWSTSDVTQSISVNYIDVFNVTYSDGNGCSSTSANVTIDLDITAPVITCPATANIGTDANACTSSASTGTATATDNCLVTISHAPSAPYSLGPTTVMWIAADYSGNSSTCTQVVNVTDNVNPVITCPADVNLTTDAGLCTSGASIGTATAIDNCAGATVSGPVPSGPYAVGSTTVTWTATDANGNTSTCTQVINVSDNENPFITCPAAANISIDAGQCTSSASIGTATATDNCSTPIVTASPAGPYPVGSTTITWTATDAGGNSATCTQIVNVTDNQNPTISCPADITSCSNTPALGTPAAGDNCTGVTVANDAPTSFPTGTTVVTWTATDANGNTATCTQSVTVTGASTAPTGAHSNASNNNICSGGSVILTQDGGVAGSGAFKWYTGSCGGTLVGSGASVTVGPLSSTTTYYVRVEGGCGTTTCASITITISTAPPANTITAVNVPVSGCVGGFGTATANSSGGALYYSWSAGAGITFGAAHTAGPFQTSSPAVQINFDALPPAGTSGWNVCVFAGNACGVSNNKCSFVRAILSTPGAISGSILGCPGTSGNYSIAAVTGAATYVWSITGAATVSGSSTSVTVNFLTGFTSGVLSVHTQTSCGYNSPNRTLSISNSPALPGVISGPASVCPNGSASFSIGAVLNASSYTWTCSVAGSVVTPSGTSCFISFPVVVPPNSQVCVTANSACTSSLVRCKSFISGVPGTPSPISGPAYGNCGFTNIGYSIPSMPLATGGYHWTVPTGCTFTGEGTNSILVNFPVAFSTGQVCAQGISAACGAGAFRCLNVFGMPATPAAITGNVSVCNGAVENYSTAGSTGSDHYNWAVPAGAIILGASTGLSVTVQWGATGGNVTVSATNNCGTSPLRLLSVAVTCRQSQLKESAENMHAAVYPNPSQGVMTIKFNSLSSGKYILKITDMTGRIILTEDFAVSEGINVKEINIADAAKGVYVIQLSGKEGNTMMRVKVE